MCVFSSLKNSILLRQPLTPSRSKDDGAGKHQEMSGSEQTLLINGFHLTETPRGCQANTNQ